MLYYPKIILEINGKLETTAEFEGKSIINKQFVNATITALKM